MTEAIMAPDGSVALDVHEAHRPKLDSGFDARTAVIFFSVLTLALFFIAYSIYVDVNETGVRTTNVLPYVLLGVALFVALGFEFVNGFHDTANAVASRAAAARPEAKAFARFCVDPENARYVRDVGYVPLPAVTLLAAARRLDNGVTGSIFGGRGSVLGVTADTFQDEDRIQNALVQ